jgi:hypothetical protein
MGHFKDSKWFLVHKIETFRGAFDFFGSKMALAIARAIYRAKKVSGPSKSRDFVQRDHFESLKWPI